jgi:hypothetical protein
LADVGVGVAEHAPFGVLGQEREHAFLAAAVSGYVVLPEQGVLPVERDGVEVDGHSAEIGELFAVPAAVVVQNTQVPAQDGLTPAGR